MARTKKIGRITPAGVKPNGRAQGAENPHPTELQSPDGGRGVHQKTEKASTDPAE